MSVATEQVTKLLLHADMDEVQELPLLGGRIAYYSRRCPDKPTENEDALGLFSASGNRAALVLADGCGGMQCGDVAAETVVRKIGKRIAKLDPDESLRGAILDGLESANEEILALGRGAATTALIVTIEDNQIRTIHAGDSQAMLIGGQGKVKLQTVSHSPVGYGVEAGLIDENQALEHEDRHLVSNIIGSEGTHFEIGSPRKLAPRDTLLLGSDGVFDNFLEGELPRLARKGPITVAANEIVEAAHYRMQHDEPDVPSKPDDLSLILFRP